MIVLYMLSVVSNAIRWSPCWSSADDSATLSASIRRRLIRSFSPSPLGVCAILIMHAISKIKCRAHPNGSADANPICFASF